MNERGREGGRERERDERGREEEREREKERIPNLLEVIKYSIISI